MLTELRIRNVGVIDDVTLVLGPGLNVLTGETGAGKTMVVSALELLLGGRADADRVRAGARTAVIEAALRPPPADAQEWLDDGDDELIVAREVTAGPDASTRSKARLGGRMAPVSALAACVGAAVELHGQSDTSRLATPSVQREVLDRFGGEELAAAAAAYGRCFQDWIATRDELEVLRTSTRDRVREADRLRFELGEIDDVSPQVGEDDALAGDLDRMQHAEALTGAASAAAGALVEDGGARDILAAAAAALRGATGHDPQLDILLRRVDSLTAEADDVGLELRSYLAGLELDPVRLEALRDRHAALVRLTRKYGDAPTGGVDVEGVVAYAQRVRADLELLESGDERVTELEAQLAALRDALQAEADRLSGQREAAGKRLAETVAQHLGELAMAGARLEVAVDRVQPGPTGADKITFLLAANPGEAVLPLGKAASGGERSRVALALRLALADADATPVLVFDEVDAGIGGATATAVGRKLAKLAAGRQVLCVTHLPQLAAHADLHFAVTKHQEEQRTVAAVVLLDEPHRVDELSRMLSGSTGSAVAADHAAELLQTARAPSRSRPPRAVG